MLRAEIADVALFAASERFGDMAIHAAIDVRRAYSRAALEQAVGAAIEAFPVLGHCYEPGFWRDRWRVVEGPVGDVVHEAEADDVEVETTRWVRTPIALTRERPIRVVCLRSSDTTRLLLTVMHLAVDGAGLAAVAHVLGAHLHGERPALPIDRRRSLGSVLERVDPRQLPLLAAQVVEALLLPSRVLSAARREQPYPADGSAHACWRWLVVSAPELARLKERCAGVSVNDILLAALARMTATRAGEGDVAVSYTMDLRRYAATPRLSAANTSTILTVMVPRDEITDLVATARSIARTTRRQRDGLAGPASMLAPMTLGSVVSHALVRRVGPSVARALVDLPLSRALLVTNVGRIDDGIAAFGDAVERVRIIGPNLRSVPVPGLVAYGYRGELHLELLAAPGLGEPTLDAVERELRAALEVT